MKTVIKLIRIPSHGLKTAKKAAKPLSTSMMRIYPVFFIRLLVRFI